MISPITGKPSSKILTTYSVEEITKLYQDRLQIDVKRFFKNISEIKVYECADTGLAYYWPRNVDGDGKFYEELERFDWYYMPSKWEHIQTLALVKPGMKVLEIGCAEGSFLEVVNQKGATSVGLELNEKATKICQEKGLEAHCAFVEDYADQHPETFDLVCSFQVVEHIANITSFINASSKLLKPGGLMVIAVPNNDSFLGYDRFNVLNLPPHHTNRWNDQSLRNIAPYFDLTWIGNELETVQPHHADYLARVIKNSAAKQMGIWPKLVFKLFGGVMKKYLADHLTMFKGFTILAKYKKQSPN
jgi:2-polyprenyl-3-methyl-5-hydroxy-6-metoxy-1,4-benzoquinol methylase